MPADGLDPGSRRSRIARRSLLLTITSLAVLASDDRRLASERTRPALRPESFGAVGLDSRDDTDALSRCLEEARSQKRPVLLTPGATYVIRGVDISGVHMKAELATIQFVGRNRSLFTAQRPFSITGGVILGPGSSRNSGPQSAISMKCSTSHSDTEWGSTNVTNVTISAFPGAAIIAESHASLTGSPHAQITLDAVTIKDCHHAVVFDGLQDTKISNSFFSNIKSHAISIKSGSRHHVRQVRVTHAGGHGIVVQYAGRVSIERSITTHCGESGITFGGGNPALSSVHDFTISNCHSAANRQSGITVDPTIAGAPGRTVPVNGTIKNNVVRLNGVHGIVLTGARDISLVNNRSVSNKKAGIALSAANIRVTGNQIDRNGTYGLALFGNRSHPNYGNHIIGTNRISHSGLAQIYVESHHVRASRWTGESRPPKGYR